MILDLDPSRWHIINDGVMGGMSDAEVIAHDSGLLFRGQLSLENNGGFASARCRFEQDFGGICGFRLTLCGDGRSYQFRLRADELSGSIAWSVTFQTDTSEQVLDLPLSAFEPVFRGRRVRDAGNMKPEEIRLMGFMLADGQPGPFSLKIHSMKTY